MSLAATEQRKINVELYPLLLNAKEDSSNSKLNQNLEIRLDKRDGWIQSDRFRNESGILAKNKTVKVGGATPSSCLFS